MDLEWGTAGSRKFITNVGLITSSGPHGDNIMAAEWTHHVSYKPGLIMINIHEVDTTYENIIKSKEFGVNLAAIDQNVASSVSGGSHGQQIDKIAILKELGFEFYKGKKIGALMLKGAVMNAECKVVKTEKIGDHAMLIGEIVELSLADKQPLVYHDGKYWHIGEQVHKPEQNTLDKIKELAERYKRS